MTDQIRPPPDDDDNDEVTGVTRAAMNHAIPSTRAWMAHVSTRMGEFEKANATARSGARWLTGVAATVLGTLLIAGGSAALATYNQARETAQTVESELPRLRAEAAGLREATEDDLAAHERHGHPQTVQALNAINERLGRIEGRLEAMDRRRGPR